MNRCIQALLAAAVLCPTLSFAQNIFIDSPPEGETVIGPTVTIRMSVADFQIGRDGRIRIAVDGIFVTETERLRVTLALPPGTHEIEARLVDQRNKPLDAIPDTVKFTLADPSM
jgi:hypothetical protein